MPITSKFEVDIAKIQQVDEATEFVIKNNCPAIVIPSEFVALMVMKRNIGGGKFKIICTVDWPKGLQRGNDKFRGLDAEALSVDGFEILLTHGTPQQIHAEIHYLDEFITNFFNTNTIELRFVLGYHLDNRDEEYINNVLTTIKTMRQPCMIRTTPLTKIPATKASVEAHLDIIKTIKAISNKPIKISGNLSPKIVAGCSADFYAVTPQQASNILSDLTDMKDLRRGK